jgi:hypothetical protein
LVEEVKKNDKHLNPQPEPLGEGTSISKMAKESEPKYAPKR